MLEWLLRRLISSKSSLLKTVFLKTDLLQHIPQIVTSEQKELLRRSPDEIEVNEAIFALNGGSASGPDGFTGAFYQSYWEIIKEDVISVVKGYFGGYTLPKFVTHTNLVLLPKKDQVNSFSDVRPISLSSFINKVISRVLHGRLVKVLPILISNNQTGFIKGRSIVENVLLAQEIIRDIKLRTKSSNVVIKLDMTKAYDRLS